MTIDPPALAVIPEIEMQAGRYREFRRDLHAYPELGFDEIRTSALVRASLTSLGLQVECGIGKTGIVGSLRRGNSSRSIGLRADMDALAIEEHNQFGHRSRHPGRFHGCGHDGHTTMLLAAADYLAAHDCFDGTVHLIFQPAEEGLGGARAMIDDGLFERFPCDGVFGMHNYPELPVGHFAVRPGPIMASADDFHVVVRGVGSHAAMPHASVDPVVIAAQLILAFQALVSRCTDPLEVAVLSVTMLRAGEAVNVIPQTATLSGTVRTLSPLVRDGIERRMHEVSRHFAAAFGADVEFRYLRNYPVLVNSVQETVAAIEAARSVSGSGRVDTQCRPITGSEDFAYMLQQVPGCYLFIGNGGGKGACMVHSPYYDFNDDIIAIGASFWVRLVEQWLPLD